MAKPLWASAPMKVLCEFALGDEWAIMLIGFAVRSQAAHGQPRETVERGVAEDWFRGRTGRRRCGRRREVLYLWLKLQLFARKFEHATLYVGQSR
jgi:hypothetical protein